MQQPYYFSSSDSQRSWLALYGHLKLKDRQLSILQNQIPRLLELTFCYTNSKMASKTKIAELLELP